MFKDIQRGGSIDKADYTREALRELRERTKQNDATACFYLGLYYLMFVRFRWVKARKYFECALRLAKETGNAALEADARRKLLVMKIMDFYKKYAMPLTEVNQLIEATCDEMSLLLGLYDKERDKEGALALLCDCSEAFLPISYAMLGAAKRIEKPPKAGINIFTISPATEGKIAKNNPFLIKRSHLLNNAYDKIRDLDRINEARRAFMSGEAIDQKE